jgi:hypothetical protein
LGGMASRSRGISETEPTQAPTHRHQPPSPTTRASSSFNSVRHPQPAIHVTCPCPHSFMLHGDGAGFSASSPANLFWQIKSKIRTGLTPSEAGAKSWYVLLLSSAPHFAVIMHTAGCLLPLHAHGRPGTGWFSHIKSASSVFRFSQTPRGHFRQKPPGTESGKWPRACALHLSPHFNRGIAIGGPAASAQIKRGQWNRTMEKVTGQKNAVRSTSGPAPATLNGKAAGLCPVFFLFELRGRFWGFWLEPSPAFFAPAS